MSTSIRRLTTVAALAATALTVQAGAASAVGSACDGTAVERCASLSVANGVWQAEGTITDTAGDGVQVDVRVDEVRIQAYDGVRWVDVLSSNAVDADGWHGVTDTGLGLRRGCMELQSRGSRIRASAHVQWRGDRFGDTWVHGAAVAPTCSG
ncbi:hypothetical protein [Phycicoccus sonneratiae]|uniref:Secreted protein n=1 Tax=Phycicoccus sonneratiae TaxID=2807628 RepID=A0ABS2CR31_9MICO|nr:hypothetical protein [Phycicoccus sonneraticus]MBM6402350.1 hypothetical protein [Phycicoccus sonneraticus]